MSTFLEGPAGTGKTTAATAQLRDWLANGIAPEAILVLTPQRLTGRPYREAARSAGASGAVGVLTFAALASADLITYWPLVAASAGFANPDSEPTLLTIETAQYHMAALARVAIARGDFASVSIADGRVISQTFDNLNRAAILSVSVDEVAARLVRAWGESPTGRPPAYHASRDLALRFRQHCLDNNLVDYSLLLDTWLRYLLPNAAYFERLTERFRYLIADNVEEMNAGVHRFLAALLPRMEDALILYDDAGGYRYFLGAEPESAYRLRTLCSTTRTFTESKAMSPALAALAGDLERRLSGDFASAPEAPDMEIVRGAFSYAIRGYYPEMLEWATEQVITLVREQGAKPGEIAIVAPYLNDSLRFALTYRLDAAGVRTFSYRPSRPLRTEPAARALLTFARLAIGDLVQPHDLADALYVALAEMDPLRARLLAVAGMDREARRLRSFDDMREEERGRISYRFREPYNRLQSWLEQHADPAQPLDHFLQELFGDVLSAAGFGFYQALDAGRVAAQIIDSARAFRLALYADASGADAMLQARRDYFALTEQGLLATVYTPPWQDEEADAVFIAPAFTFLMRNRFVKYQIWLDIGSAAWYERIEQPLTHPYVLRAENANLTWTDTLETEEAERRLYSIISGLVRRCREHIYLGIADLNEEGFLQNGPMLSVFQNILMPEPEE